jgi:alpha-galactosidase
VQILDLMNGLETYAGPGHWNDPDMLEVGNGGMSKEEYRMHFSMWAMLAAPLLAGNNVANMTADTKEILLNKEVIAIDQDALRQQGRRVKKTGDLEVWSKQLQDGGRAVALVNRGASTAKISVAWTDIGYPDAVSAKVRDLWTKKESSAVKSGYSAEVPSHGAVMVRVKP